MPKIKILNLYAGIGGNRKLWPNDKIDVTAVEIEPKIAKIYQDFFPNDKVIVADAHQFLLDHFKEFDFIWSSPPCPTHSVCNDFLHPQGIIRYPDMALWQEIIFLKEWSKGKYAIENVVSYYEPFIEPQQAGRHYFWSNFKITDIPLETEIGTFNRSASKTAQIRNDMKYMDANRDWLGFNLKDIKMKSYDKRQILRNCVNPILGLHIFNMAFRDKQVSLNECSLSKEKTQV